MLKITGLFTLAAVLFGLVHDQITVRVCVEYFTVAHETLAAREGPWPKLPWRHFVRPALALAGLMGGAALLASILGYVLTARGIVRIVADYEDLIAPERHARFMADVWAHLASYAVGLLGGVAIAVQALRARRRLAALKA